MPSAFYDEGLRLLEEQDWVGAIRSLSWAKDAEPGVARPWLALIGAYETAAAAEDEPDLLQQAFNVCRDLRDRRLPMSDEERRAFYEAFVRVRDKVVAARATGWTPPPPKERMGSV
ncbi:MAG TPA: hypothetical protein VFB49_02180 [Patescibacteria group bacterium]|nr:hypothetical protein [Patescibacteria group bacterium]